MRTRNVLGFRVTWSQRGMHAAGGCAVRGMHAAGCWWVCGMHATGGCAVRGMHGISTACGMC